MDYAEMVRRTAEGRDIAAARGGSISFNRAAEQLLRGGDDALVAIETFLRSEETREVPSQTRLPGISALFAAYLVLSATDRAVAAERLFRTLGGSLREEAMRAILVRWGPASGSRHGRPPEPIVAFVRSLLKSGSVVERDLASKLLDHMAHLDVAV